MIITDRSRLTGPDQSELHQFAKSIGLSKKAYVPYPFNEYNLLSDGMLEIAKAFGAMMVDAKCYNVIKELHQKLSRYQRIYDVASNKDINDIEVHGAVIESGNK